jgi:hypothetical protein
VRPAATPGPVAVLGGIVRPAALPVSSPAVVRTASARHNVGPWVIATLVLLGSVLAYRKFPRPA